MKNRFIAVLMILMLLLCSCAPNEVPTEPSRDLETQPPVTSEPKQEEPQNSETEPPETESPETETPETQATEETATEPVHSELYLPSVSVEDVIVYFNEVCLDGEFINSGDPSFVQKWTAPIYYTLEGDYTDTDISVLNAFEIWLNSVEGFPGIYPAEDPAGRNLRICFCSQQEMVNLMGPNFEYMDGGVTFWYYNDEIYDAIICYRTDVDQEVRNSVILEEIYNGLGPIQDTVLRPTSIIYQEYSMPQWLSPVDELIMKLLYHPDIRPGMSAEECEQVIRSLYY